MSVLDVGRRVLVARSDRERVAHGPLRDLAEALDRDLAETGPRPDIDRVDDVGGVLRDIDATLRLDLGEGEAAVVQHAQEALLVRLEFGFVESVPRLHAHGRHGRPHDLHRQERDARRIDAAHPNELSLVHLELDPHVVLVDVHDARRDHLGLVVAARAEKALDAFEVLRENRRVVGRVLEDARDHPEEERRLRGGEPLERADPYRRRRLR